MTTEYLTIANEILIDREKRKILINQLIKKYNVICLKANIPGYNKNISYAKIIIFYFDKLLLNTNYINKYNYESKDGPYILYTYDKTLTDVNVLKAQMIELEEREEIGRLVDLDVFGSEPVSLSRSGNRRKCLICNEEAFVCNRLQRHTYSELITKISEITFNKVCELVKECFISAVEKELIIPYKFGAVCKNDSSSHRDMNYQTMIKARDAIIPGLLEMLEIGFKNKSLTKTFHEIRKVGLKTESAMYLATSGINCYKGLIFSMGLIVASIGYELDHDMDFSNIFYNISKMTKGIDTDYNTSSSFGIEVYKKYNFMGAREQAKNGYQIIKRSFYNTNSLDTNSLIKTLVFIINNIDDTVMLKRCGSIEKYKEVKKKIANLDLSLIDNENYNEIIKVNDYCINNNISTGGACDMLVCTIFLKELMSRM